MFLIILTIPDFCRKDSEVCNHEVDEELDGEKWHHKYGRFERFKDGRSELGNRFGLMYNLMLGVAILSLVLILIGSAAIIMQSIALFTSCYEDNCYKVTTFVMAVLYVFFVYIIIVLDIWVAILWYTVNTERNAPKLGMVSGQKDLGKDVMFPQNVRLMLDHLILLCSFPYLVFSVLAFLK